MRFWLSLVLALVLTPALSAGGVGRVGACSSYGHGGYGFTYGFSYATPVLAVPYAVPAFTLVAPVYSAPVAALPVAAAPVVATPLLAPALAPVLAAPVIVPSYAPVISYATGAYGYGSSCALVVRQRGNPARGRR